MGDLTANLSLNEFACKCSLPTCTHKETADYRLVNALQSACDYFKSKYKAPVSITITSGNRCREHNAAEGGKPESKHIYCIAADLKISVKIAEKWHQVDPQEVYNYFDTFYSDRYGLGLYHNRVHFDVRSRKARWVS